MRGLRIEALKHVPYDKLIRMTQTCSWLIVLILLSVLPGFYALAQDAPTADATLGLYVGEGAHPDCVGPAREMFESMGLHVRDITAGDINNARVDDIDIFYFAGGESGPYIDDISAAGKSRLRQQVREGAIYIGTCAGAMFGAAVQVWEGEDYSRGQLGVFPGDAVGPAPNICGPSGGVCKCMIDVNTEHPISQGLPESIEIYYYNSPFFRWPGGESVEVIATYQATGEPTVIVAEYGDGRVLLTGVHPEWIPDEPWTLMTNAVLWCLGLLSPSAG